MNKLVGCAVAIVLLSSGCHQDSGADFHTYGEVEVREVSVASRLSSRVAKVMVKSGQKVKKGDILVTFENDVLAAKKQRALATIKAAETQKAIAENAVRPEEKAQLEAAVKAAEKQMDFALTSLKRMKTLLKDGAISQQSFDEIEVKYQSLKAKYEAARAKLTMGEKGARKEQKLGAEAMVEKARTGLQEVEAFDKDLELRAPMDAEVFEILADEGELVPKGFPVVTLLKTTEPWVTLQVPETKLGDYTLDKDVTLDIPSLKLANIGGKIYYVSPLAGFATKVYTQDKASIDLKTFEIRVSIAEPPKDIRPGMTVIINNKTRL